MVLVVPECLNFKNNRAETISLLDRCRKTVFEERRRIMLDFSRTKAISPPASLVLLAEIFRSRRTAGADRLTGNYPADKGVEEQLQDCGFFDVLAIHNPSPGKEATTFPRSWIKFITGEGAQGELAEAFKKAILGERKALNKAASDAFYRGLSEAMTNVSQHADPDEPERTRIVRMPRRWWLLGHVDHDKKAIRIMIFDQGVGIPKSLRRKHAPALVQGVLEFLKLSPTDGEMIRAAMDIGRTRTGARGRGMGLNDLRRLVDQCGAGYLRILSNRGEMIYDAKLGFSMQTHSDSVRGTFIEWVVPLEKILDISVGSAA